MKSLSSFELFPFELLLPFELLCLAKLFADDTSLFSVVENVNETTANLNKDLQNKNKWGQQWQKSFNLDPTKMAQEVLFSRKKSNVIHPSLIFNGKDFSRSESHKRLVEADLGLPQHPRWIAL